MKALITGGAGFIGHHLVEHILRNRDWEIILLDRLDFSGNLNRLHEIGDFEKHKKRMRWVYHDLKAPISTQLRAQIGDVDLIFHLAAGTHVDRSITHPLEFVYDNVVGTANLLEFARQACRGRVVYFSTDEVFGPAARRPEEHRIGSAYPSIQLSYKEWDRYRSANPYAATKAGAEELCLAYENTYKIPILVTHCMNVIGERQSPEKFVPSTIKKVRDRETVIIHADTTKTRPGSRYYIHARNVADAVLTVVDKGISGDKYNIVGEVECDNLQMASLIADIQGKTLSYEMVDFHSSRPGHDLRYSLDGTKLAEMGWKPPVSFGESLTRVVEWSLANPRWLL